MTATNIADRDKRIWIAELVYRSNPLVGEKFWFSEWDCEPGQRPDAPSEGGVMGHPDLTSYLMRSPFADNFRIDDRLERGRAGLRRGATGVALDAQVARQFERIGSGDPNEFSVDL
jgi:hypothetical protein